MITFKLINNDNFEKSLNYLFVILNEDKDLNNLVLNRK